MCGLADFGFWISDFGTRHLRSEIRNPQSEITTHVALLALVLLAWSPLVAAYVTGGVARETFSLPAGVPLAGYSRRGGKPSRGLHDPVGVRALVVVDDTAAVALVSCDLLIIDEALFDAVARRLSEQGVPADLVLLLAATHTHSGPGAYGRRFLEKLSMGHFDPRVFDALVEAIARAVVRAWQTRAAVRVASASGATEGLVENRVELGGMVDPEVTVSGFYPADADQPFALLVTFAAHPTTLGAWNMELSADYPGVVMRELERRIPSAIALFFAGAVGDQAPVKSGERFDRPERMGLAVAERALALAAGLHPEPPSGVSARQERISLPPAQVRAGSLMFPRWLGRRLVDDDATLSVVTVGSVAFLGVPCDLAASLGGRLKDAARRRGLQPRVVGFACDYIGYCVPESLYRAKQYESSMAFNGPKAGELVTDQLIRMLDQIADQ